MKLATVIVEGAPRLVRVDPGGLLDVAVADPTLAGLSDIGALLRSGESPLEAVAALPSRLLLEPHGMTFAPPVLAPGKILGIGLNYRRHAAEGGLPVPSQPVLFAKYANALIGHGAPVTCSPLTTQLDYEAELGVVIGHRARRLAPDEAIAVVAGYTNVNDISARDLQHGLAGGQWTFGKTLDGFCPMGPYLVTLDEAGPWQDIRVRMWVNGELRQDEMCADMVFGVPELISYLSQGITLEPGDVILTGTPSGVGLGFNPPRWLAPGDVMEVALSRLGQLANVVSST